MGQIQAGSTIVDRAFRSVWTSCAKEHVSMLYDSMSKPEMTTLENCEGLGQSVAFLWQLLHFWGSSLSKIQCEK